MIKSLVLFAMSFFSLTSVVQTKSQPEINYILVHTGATSHNIENNNSFYKFSSSFDDEYIMATKETLSECKLLCTKKTRCLGLAHYYDENNHERCNLLTNLGDVSHTYMNISSYKKVAYYKNTNLHSLQGKVLDTFHENLTQNHKIYLDLNLNGIFDYNEPYNTTNSEGDFVFTNLSVNNYLIREVQEDNCIQLVPGIRGINGIVRGSGFVDNVVEYYFDGHESNAYFNGGRITNITTGEFTRKTNVLWYTYNKRDNMFVSFFPEYTVVYAFVDEAIIDGPGADIVITTFLNSTTNAHVSVSKNNIDFEYLGVLNGASPSPHEFDLSDINYEEHVAYLSLHFFDAQSELDHHKHDVMPLHKCMPLNIATIVGKRESLAVPSFGMFSSVPQKSKDSLIFIKDCHYEWGCMPYCIFGRVEKDHIESCFTGCKLWKETTTCKCSNYKKYDITFKGTEFDKEQCIDGCKYAINREIFPDYTLRIKTGGVKHHNFLNNQCNYTSNKECFLDNIKICSGLDNCSAISFNSSYYGMVFDSFEFLDDNSSRFLVKNEHLGDNELENYGFTTSPTSTQTTSQTTSQTSTPTTSPTITYINEIQRSRKLSDTNVVIIILSSCILLVFILLLISVFQKKKT